MSLLRVTLHCGFKVVHTMPLILWCVYHSAEGLLSMLEVGEAAQRAEQPIDVRQLRADALRAERAIKANRDRVTTRRDAENAQHESVTGTETVCFRVCRQHQRCQDLILIISHTVRLTGHLMQSLHAGSIMTLQFLIPACPYLLLGTKAYCNCLKTTAKSCTIPPGLPPACLTPDMGHLSRIMSSSIVIMSHVPFMPLSSLYSQQVAAMRSVFWPVHTAGYEAVDDNPVDPAFSLAGQRLKSMSKAEVEEWIGIACRKWEANSVLERALCRGIGVHHSGMPIKYRQVVEILFRCGHLRVVLATGDISAAKICD